MDIESIPQVLKDLPQWVAWKYETRDGKVTKPPFNAKTGRLASNDNPADWTTFDEALAGYRRHDMKGVGFVFTADDAFVGVDLDECIIDGVMAPAAKDIIDSLASYTEITPSGKGVHIIIRGAKPGEKCKTKKVDGFKEIEIYDSGRYFTMTGNHIDTQPRSIEDRQTELDALYAKYFPPPVVAPAPVTRAFSVQGELDELKKNGTLTDWEVERFIRDESSGKGSRLWSGDTGDYGGDDSRADAALAAKIAFYVGGDHGRIDTIFRKSGLFREKWNRADYRKSTIDGAVNTMGGNFYTGKKPSGENGQHKEKRTLAEFPTFLPITQLPDDVEVDGLWGKYVFAGHITMLVALWKSGKTTLLSHVLRASQRGGDVAGDVVPCKVLVISEESSKLWRRRVNDLGLGPNVEILCRPFKQKLSLPDWRAFIDYVAETAKAGGHKLVIFDTVSAYWPVSDENNPTEMQATMLPMHAIAETGAGVMLFHHPKKGDSGEGQASRGSGALPGFVDVIMEMRRYSKEDRNDRRRTIVTYSRFDETPPEQVIELGEDGYRVIGLRSDATRADRIDVIESILPEDTEQAMTAAQVREAWPESSGIPKPGKRAIELDLQAGADLASQRFIVMGAGKKNDPLRYCRDVSRTLRGVGRARIELQFPSLSSENDGNYVNAKSYAERLGSH